MKELDVIRGGLIKGDLIMCDLIRGDLIRGGSHKTHPIASSWRSNVS